MQSNNKQWLHKQKAVTLVELLIVIAIVGIISSIALPSYRSLVITNRINSFATNLHGSLLLARTEAIKRSRSVAICKSSNADHTVPSCDVTASIAGTNTGWGSGWLIFVDSNNDGLFLAPDVLLRVQSNFISSVNDGSIVPTNPDGSAGNEFIAFNATGQTVAAINFVINRPTSDTVASHNKAVCVLVGGRARSGLAPNCP